MKIRIAAIVAAVLLSALSGSAQRGEPVRQESSVLPGPPVNSAPNPYRAVHGWYQWPQRRAKGSIPAVAVGKNDHIWAIERCGITGFIAAACAESKLDPIFEFDQSGKILHNWGAGMFVFPHGIGVDADGNVWVTDGQAKDGKGHQVFKFSPDGKLLMTLGTRGVAGGGPDHFNQPNAVAFAPNGDVFIGEGHGGDNGNRIVKFTKDGKYIKEWGKRGTGPGEFDIIHHMTFDSKGQLYVADRNNNRIQVFDQDGKFLRQYTQFSRPSGIAIDKNDVIYVSDSESESVSRNHYGWKRGIRVGSLKDGKVAAFIPDPVDKADTTSSAEGIAIDSKGAIYGAEVVPNDLKKYVRK
jgi:DNA-binding beta-propeller fold protein YncE